MGGNGKFLCLWRLAAAAASGRLLSAGSQGRGSGRERAAGKLGFHREPIWLGVCVRTGALAGRTAILCEREAGRCDPGIQSESYRFQKNLVGM